ncbi:hypothetical protein VO57_015330 [Citromicrobium bathyomarinum]|nr:hypothetical protein [Citromicrobium sp. JL2201]
MVNCIIISAASFGPGTTGSNCVVIGDCMLLDREDLGDNLFHVAGVCSVHVRSEHWRDAVHEAREEIPFHGAPVALEPLCEIAQVPADDVRRATVETLHLLRARPSR